jgi:hypothetical protein
MKKIVRYLLFILIFFVVSIAGLGIAGVLLEEELVKYSLEQLNKQINATIKVQQVTVSLIRGFPFASVKLMKVEITEGSLNTPPELEPGLLALDEVVIKIGLLGIINNEYLIDKLILRNGWINLYFDHTGKGNFEIFSSSDSTSGKWLLDFNQFVLENVTLSYIDPKTGWVLKSLIEEARLKGFFSSDLFMLDLKSKMRIAVLKQGNFYFLKNKDAKLAVVLKVDENTVDFETDEILVGKTRMNAKGSFGKGIGSPIHLRMNGQNLEVAMLVSLLSQYNISLASDTKTKGQLAFNLLLDGFNKVDKPFLVDLTFSSGFLELKFPQKPTLTISNIKGNFNNGNSNNPEASEIKIQSMNLKSGGSTINGSLKVKNIISPLYHLNINHAIDIGDLNLWGLDIPLKSGRLQGKVEALGILDGIENIKPSDFSRIKFDATIDYSNVSLDTSFIGLNIEKLTGKLQLFNQDITKGTTQGYFNDSRFDGDFKIQNATALFFGGGKATLTANLIIDSLNTSFLQSKVQHSTTQPDEFSLFDRINSVSGDISIDKFLHEGLQCNPLNANFFITKNSLLSNSFIIRSCGGLFTGRLGSTANNLGERSFSADINIDGVDINQLFSSFNNFGQSIIEASNISGMLDGNILINAPIIDGSILNEGTVANSHLKISNGRLVGVKELEGLSKFISLEELKDIQFQTMENNIIIENQEVITPKMEIKSSALDISLSGRHGFLGNYIYHIELLLSDILTKKATRNKPENDEFGEIENDMSGRMKLFLKIEGNEFDYKVSYDKRAAREALRESYRNEKQTLQNILREEFGFLRRKESSIENAVSADSMASTSTKDKPLIKSKSKKEEKEKSTKFEIDWDDN